MYKPNALLSFLPNLIESLSNPTRKQIILNIFSFM
jgi:hypothetical protein